MFEEITFLSPQLPISNYSKGGDCMAVESGPIGPVTNVRVEGRIPGTSEDPFPKVKGRRAPVTDPISRSLEEMEMAGFRTVGRPLQQVKP